MSDDIIIRMRRGHYPQQWLLNEGAEEIERLRAEYASTQKTLVDTWDRAEAAEAERDALRAKWLARSIRLATKWRAVRNERDALRALLNEAHSVIEEQEEWLDERGHKILAALKEDGDE